MGRVEGGREDVGVSEVAWDGGGGGGGGKKKVPATWLPSQRLTHSDDRQTDTLDTIGLLSLRCTDSTEAVGWRKRKGMQR